MLLTHKEEANASNSFPDGHGRFSQGATLSEDTVTKANKKIRCIKKRSETNINLIFFPQKNTKHSRYKRLSERQKRWLDSLISDLLLKRDFKKII